ncbi:MAG TPA: methanol dehydrogenase [Bacteroidetes bacterium]|nr:methanol dehydrogenase [Bacteroidota bacterium]HRR10260.1 TPM domain-containing protein [Rhodothermales bacterium]
MRYALRLLCLLLLGIPVYGQKINLKSAGPVTDVANLFSNNEREILRQKLNAYEDSTSNQFVVVTIPSLEGMDANQYATELGHQWGVGTKNKDNGVIILISKGDRKAYIAIGRGLEANITDFTAKQIVRQYMVPAFRQGQYFQGTNTAVDALISAASGAYKSDASSSGDDDFSGLIFFLFILILIILFFVVVSKASRRNRGGDGFGGGYGGGPIIFGSGWDSSSSSSSGWGSSGSSDFGFGGGDFGGGGAGDSW